MVVIAMYGIHYDVNYINIPNCDYNNVIMSIGRVFRKIHHCITLPMPQHAYCNRFAIDNAVFTRILGYLQVIMIVAFKKQSIMSKYT